MSISSYFVTNNFSYNLYNNVVLKMFPNMVHTDTQLLHEYLINILNVIACTFNFDLLQKDKYEYQFVQNDYLDAKSLLLLLLPFINDDSGEKKRKLHH